MKSGGIFMENETIVGVHPLDLRGGWGWTCFDVYFTNKRMIASFLENRSISRFWGHSVLMVQYKILDAAVVAPLTKRADGVSSADPEEIFKADKRNLSWDYDKDIATIKAKVRTGLVGPPHIEVKLNNGKKYVLTQDRERRQELIDLLRKVVGNKLTVEG
jgi:hypothetical protein